MSLQNGALALQNQGPGHLQWLACSRDGVGRWREGDAVQTPKESTLRPVSTIITRGLSRVRVSSMARVCTQSCPALSAPWTVARLALPSMGFSRQQHWNGLSFSTPGDCSNPEMEPVSLASPSLAGGFFTPSASWEAHLTWTHEEYHQEDRCGWRQESRKGQKHCVITWVVFKEGNKLQDSRKEKSISFYPLCCSCFFPCNAYQYVSTF